MKNVHALPGFEMDLIFELGERQCAELLCCVVALPLQLGYVTVQRRLPGVTRSGAAVSLLVALRREWAGAHDVMPWRFSSSLSSFEVLVICRDSSVSEVSTDWFKGIACTTAWEHALGPSSPAGLAV